MPTHCITIDLADQGRRKVRDGCDGGRMSSDGGALLLRAILAVLLRKTTGQDPRNYFVCYKSRFCITSLDARKMGTTSLRSWRRH